MEDLMGKRKQRKELERMLQHARQARRVLVPRDVSQSAYLARRYAEESAKNLTNNRARYTSDTIAPTETADQYAARVEGGR